MAFRSEICSAGYVGTVVAYSAVSLLKLKFLLYVFPIFEKIEAREERTDGRAAALSVPHRKGRVKTADRHTERQNAKPTASVLLTSMVRILFCSRHKPTRCVP